LTNVFVHYLRDLWVRQWRQRHVAAALKSCTTTMTSSWASRIRRART